MIPFTLISAVFAGSVYINGVRADVLPEVTIANASVRFDAQGNVWVDAPGYKVQVLPPTEYAVARPADVPAPPPPAGASAVTAGVWWLVTQDDASTGQVVEVVVNGSLVRRVRSGDPQVILDIGPWLRPGANLVLMNPIPGTAGGGPLNVYIGRGSNLSGTIHLDNPDVNYARRASEAGSGAVRQFTINVP
jgi:hypothetical protein